MARTPYEKENDAFSQKAHCTARKILYPRMFPKCELQFCSCNKSEDPTSLHYKLDKQMAIDKIVQVRPQGEHYRAPVNFTFQERFRSMEYYRWREVTITEWNNFSDKRGEFYKLYPHYFAYGYYDEETQCFAEAIVLNVPALQVYLLGQARLKIERNGKGQDFVCLAIDTLLREPGLVFYHERNDDPRWYDEADETEQPPTLLEEALSIFGGEVVANIEDYRR